MLNNNGNKERNPYLSIVIPVYNVEKYLRKCLDSVLNQNYRDFECILVDDGSLDKSGEICDQYAEIDARITVIHKTNGGLVSARKAGLQKANGEFVGCVDSDDWIEKDYFESLVNRQIASGADIVAANHFRDIGEQSYAVFNNIAPGIYTKETILSQLIYSGTFFIFGLHPSLCTKIIRREILNTTQMSVDEEIFCEEDGAVVYPSVLEAKQILLTEICGYHYVQHQGSITKTAYADDLRRLKIVFWYLKNAFVQKGAIGELHFQLNQWKKFIFVERQIGVFDEKNDKETILFPYGGIAKGSRIVIYGGSRLGQTINRYVIEEKLAEVVLWIDKAYENFQNQGLAINKPEDIQTLSGKYDYVLLASVTESIVISMKQYLIDMQVPESKILWLKESFIEEEYQFEDE